MSKVTLEQFHAWAKEHSALALTVCKAQAMVELKQEYVDSYILPLFYSFEFEKSPIMERKRFPETIVDHPDTLYLCTDEEKVSRYYDACDKAHREHGFDGPYGHDPVYPLKKLHTEAENLLLAAGQDLFGIMHVDLSLDHREKMLDLLLGACLKAAKGEN